MRIDVVTGFPKTFRGPLTESIIRQAKRKKLIQIRLHDLRKFAHDKHKTIDDTPFGGGAGMVLKPEPIFECIESLQKKRTYDEVIYLTADGEQLTQKVANQLSLSKNLLLLCGHYKGVDDRVRQSLITKEISIGDYVLTGGEVGAIVLIDTIVRLIPGVISDAESLLTDSFQDELLDCPNYTRPADFRSMKVPKELLSGNHKEIQKWRQQQRLERTQTRRKDLITHQISQSDKKESK